MITAIQLKFTQSMCDILTVRVYFLRQKYLVRQIYVVLTQHSTTRQENITYTCYELICEIKSKIFSSGKILYANFQSRFKILFFFLRPVHKKPSVNQSYIRNK